MDDKTISLKIYYRCIAGGHSNKHHSFFVHPSRDNDCFEPLNITLAKKL